MHDTWFKGGDENSLVFEILQQKKMASMSKKPHPKKITIFISSEEN